MLTTLSSHGPKITILSGAMAPLSALSHTNYTLVSVRTKYMFVGVKVFKHEWMTTLLDVKTIRQC